MTKQIYSFGVGCFHFQSKIDVKHDAEDAAYFMNLKKFLTQDSSIKNVSFEQFEYNNFLGRFSEVEENDNDLSSINYMYPIFSQGKMRIDLAVPFRLQEEYLGSFREKLKSENIYVVINFNDNMPCAFVYTDKLESSPSTAVTIVWKHFKNVLKEDNNIRFMMLGPSPFHADFFVNYKDESPFNVDYSKQIGYDRVTIDIAKQQNIQRAKDIVEYAIHEEAGLYYHIVRNRNMISEKIHIINSKIHKLSRTGYKIREKISNFFDRNSVNTYDCLIDVEKIQLSISEICIDALEQIEILERRAGKVYIEEKIRYELENLQNTPLVYFKNILSTIKDRHNLSSTNRAVITSTIIGVLCGYILTAAPNVFKLFVSLFSDT